MHVFVYSVLGKNASGSAVHRNSGSQSSSTSQERNQWELFQASEAYLIIQKIAFCFWCGAPDWTFSGKGV